MAINVRIERLILENLPLTADQGGLVQAALETELASLLEQDNTSLNLERAGFVPGISPAPLQLAGNLSPAELGRQIARAVYGGLKE